MTPSTSVIRLRDIVVLFLMVLLLSFWFIPITGLASLLSYKEIKKVMPWLGQLIDANDQIRAIVQNSLPSVAMITLNALLPFMLEGVSSYDTVFARSLKHSCRCLSFDLHPRIQSSQLDRILPSQEVHYFATPLIVC